ncbi:MAG: stage III sporulation protein AB [Oscillospiraceae bacterium]|jgi:stage III sporulation protein AB|nr:stage III sporulation protein AB [Oscillospiraceae bacterium]
MPLKYIALSLLFLACGGTGALLSRQLHLRARELELCLQMVASLRAQLQFLRPPLEQMVEDVCAQSRCPVFLPHCLRGLRQGIGFPGAWREALAAHGGGLREDDRLQLLLLGEILGNSDAAGQREARLLQDNLLQTRFDQARAARDGRGKSLCTLGILAGVTVLILFL